MRNLLAIAAAAILTATTASAENLKVGTECTYHPFNYRTDDGTLTGYDVDVANEIAKRIGAEIEYVCQEWKGMIPALLAGKFDLIVASMSITEKRLEQIDFSAPYRVSIGQFVGKPELALFNGDELNPAGFEGVKIGLERATTYEEWIRAKVPSADVAYYDSNEAMYLDLAAGRVDAIMTNPMKAYLKFLSEEGNDTFTVLGPQIAEEAYFGIGVGVGLRQGQDDLKTRINAALKGMTEDGTLGEFGLRYFPFTIHPQEWKGAS
ncbi:MAG: transporter substrate-binding domain-containing protein [Pseudomonadota bacterium]